MPQTSNTVIRFEPDASESLKPMTLDPGNFAGGLWGTQTLGTDNEPFPRNAFAEALEGEGTITGQDGDAQTFKKGVVFFGPKGTVCEWQVPRALRTYRAALDPKIRPGDPA